MASLLLPPMSSLAEKDLILLQVFGNNQIWLENGQLFCMYLCTPNSVCFNGLYYTGTCVTYNSGLFNSCCCVSNVLMQTHPVCCIQ